MFVSPNFGKYTEASSHTRAIFACFDPDYESASLDEAYLDVTSYRERMGVSGAEVGCMHAWVWFGLVWRMVLPYNSVCRALSGTVRGL